MWWIGRCSFWTEICTVVYVISLLWDFVLLLIPFQYHISSMFQYPLNVFFISSQCTFLIHAQNTFSIPFIHWPTCRCVTYMYLFCGYGSIRGVSIHAHGCSQTGDPPLPCLSYTTLLTSPCPSDPCQQIFLASPHLTSLTGQTGLDHSLYHRCSYWSPGTFGVSWRKISLCSHGMCYVISYQKLLIPETNRKNANHHHPRSVVRKDVFFSMINRRQNHPVDTKWKVKINRWISRDELRPNQSTVSMVDDISLAEAKSTKFSR